MNQKPSRSNGQGEVCKCINSRCLVTERVVSCKDEKKPEPKKESMKLQEPEEDTECVEVYRDLGECLQKCILQAAEKHKKERMKRSAGKQNEPLDKHRGGRH